MPDASSPRRGSPHRDSPRPRERSSIARLRVVAVAVAALTAQLTALSACRPRGPTNLCPRFEVAAAEARENESRELDAATWLGEMLPGFDRASGRPAPELRDCRGRRIEPPLNTCAPERHEEGAQPLPLRSLDREDLAFTDREGGEFLIWAKAQRFADGEALGPIAFAQWTPRGAAILAVDALRGPGEHTRLRLEPLGLGEALVVEGDLCPATQPRCHRVVRILPFMDGHFIDPPMRLRAGGCAGPATFPLTGDAEVTLASGILRRFRLQRSVVVKDGDAIVFEEVVVTDLDPRQEESAGAEFRRSSKERRITLDADGLIVDPGIWEEILLEDGSIRPSDFRSGDSGRTAADNRSSASSPRAVGSVDALGAIDVATLADPQVFLEVEVDRLDPPLLHPLALRPAEVDVVSLGERLDLGEPKAGALLLPRAVDLGPLVAGALRDHRELVALILRPDEAEGADDLSTLLQVEGHPEDRHPVALADAEDLAPGLAPDRHDLGLAELPLRDLAMDLKGLFRRLLIVAEDRLATDVDPEILHSPALGLDLRQLLRRQTHATGTAGIGGDQDRDEERDEARRDRSAHLQRRVFARRVAGVNGRRR